MKATLTNYQQSPRKVRLVADLIRRKSVVRARSLLSFADKKSAPAVLKLLESAVASARAEGSAAENLVVKDIQVTQGLSLKRIMPMARGQAHRYRHRRASIILVLDAKKEVKAEKKAPKKTAKKRSEE